jgi:hypothetical protein
MNYSEFCEKQRFYDQLFLDRLEAYCEAYKDEGLYFNDGGIIRRRTWVNSYGVYLYAKDKRMVEIAHDTYQIEYTYKIDDYCGGDEEEYLTTRGEICSIEDQSEYSKWLKECKDSINKENEILKEEYEKVMAQKIAEENTSKEEKERLEYERLKAKFENKETDPFINLI